MGYSIQYGPNKVYRKIGHTAGKHKSVLWIAIVAAVVIPCLLLTLWGYKIVEGEEQYSFPGQSPSVRQAFRDFSDSVRSGEDFTEALECLYQEILKNEIAE